MEAISKTSKIEKIIKLMLITIVGTIIITISVIPASRIDSIQYSDIGLFAIGKSCFGPVCVNGLSLVPCPP